MSLNQIFKALSDSTRRKILRLLQKQDLSAGDIAMHFDMSKPSISHHLSVLKQADLVQDLRQGQNIYYSINSTVFQEVLGWFFELMNYEVKYNEKEGKHNLQTGDDKLQGGDGE
ncbi:MAG: autorepressor SdpR family transcription factor [Syntrophomonadales bacterium]